MHSDFCHQPHAQPHSSLKPHRLLLLMQMLTVHRAGECIHTPAPSATPPQGPELPWTQPIKDLQTRELQSQHETFDPAHRSVALVSGFLRARQQEPVNVPGRAGSQRFCSEVDQSSPGAVRSSVARHACTCLRLGCLGRLL